MQKILITRRLDNNTRYGVYNDISLLKSDEEYEIDEEFILALFDSFQDYGPIIDTWLKEGATSFGGNCSSGRLISGTNEISFWSDFDENETTHIMDFEDFLRLNDEFHYLTFQKPDLIIFRREGELVTIEGTWNKEN